MQDKKSKGRSYRNSGIKCPLSKLKEEDVLKIRELRKEGMTLVNISKIFNVTDANICDICNRKTWRHI
mgnify:FL=1